MIKWAYLIVVFWILIPLIIFFLLPGIATFFKSKNIQLVFRKILAFILGIRKGKLDGDYIYQYGNLDCSEISLKNIFVTLDKALCCNFSLPQNSSMRDIHDAALKNGLYAIGQKNVSWEELERDILESNRKIMALIKVFYPFNGFWVYPTRLFMKLMTSKVDALHWVVIGEISNKHVILIDPYFGCISLTHRKFLEVWNNVIIKFDIKGE